jgi:putative tricarboxylic transport membrane protein
MTRARRPAPGSGLNLPMHKSLVAVLMFGALAASGAILPDYPERPIVLLVGYGAGGASDLVARALAEALKKHLGQPLIVKDQPGPSGTFAITNALSAKPDGYTLGLGTEGTLTVQPNRTVLAYGGPDTYVPVAKLTTGENLLITKLGAPWRTAHDLLEYARVHPGAVSIGVPGFATVAHLNVAQLAALAKVDLKVVYFDGPQQVEAAVRGQVDAAVAAAGPIRPYITSRKAVVLGVFDDRRLAMIPEVATLKEQGFDVALRNFNGIIAPRGTPTAVVNVLDDAISKAVTEPSFVSFAEENGNTVDYKSTEAFVAELRQVFVRNRDLIRALRLNIP